VYYKTIYKQLKDLSNIMMLTSVTRGNRERVEGERGRGRWRGEGGRERGGNSVLAHPTTKKANGGTTM
jgi:hypothetical protein